MKARIKNTLKTIPFVQKYVAYKNYRNRKVKINHILAQNTERYRTLKYTGSSLVSIIILNRNGIDKLKDLMESFEKSDFYSNFEIVFVDNASTDDSVQYMEKWKNAYDIRIICNDENRSFSAANNQAAKVAKGEYLLFLNNDVAVTDGWLDELLLAIEQADNPGAIGARLIYPEVSGEKERNEKAYAVQHRGIAFKDAIRKKQYFIRPYNMNMGDMASETDVTLKERAAVTAAALMVGKSAFESVGGFSEEYFYGFEDVDLGLKLHKAGYKNYYCPGCLIYHYEFGTRDKGGTPEAKKRGDHNVAVFQGKWQKYLSKVMLIDKLEKKGLFTEQPLRIAIACNENEKDASLLALESQLKGSGYKVVYLNSHDRQKYYDIKPVTDVLLILDTDYKVNDIYNRKNDLLIICIGNATCDNSNNLREYCADFDEILYNKEWLSELIRDYVKEELDDKMVDICGCMPNNENKKFWGDYHFAEAMKREFEKKGYRANVLTKDEWYHRSKAKYTIFLRGNREYYPTLEDGRKSIMWNISHPDEVSIEEYNAFDYVFFASSKAKSNMEEHLHCESGVLQQCTDEQVMQAEEHIDKKYELLFVGNSRRVYRQILKDLLPTKYQLTVYGRHWEEYPVQEYVVSDYVANEEVGQTYHDAKILLNDHWDDMKEQGIISNRIFDALSAGAFVISDYMPEIDETFDGAVVTYQNKEDLAEKIDYFMEHEDERLEKAALGQSIVLKEHTFRNRIEKMIEVMETL